MQYLAIAALTFLLLHAASAWMQSVALQNTGFVCKRRTISYRRSTQLKETSTSTSSENKDSALKAKLTEDMKNAMRNKEKSKLSAIRAILTAIKQKEVDDRVAVTDEMIISIMSKLVKQRKESIKSYLEGGRQDLVAAEQEECDYIVAYMPQQMSSQDIKAFVDEVVARLGATTIKDMGKVMAQVKPALAGKADLAEVGEIIKAKLSPK